MALGSKLSASDRAKARKTPVHGAVDKALRVFSGSTGSTKTSTRKSTQSDARAATARARAQYRKDVAKAKAEGWKRKNGTWVKVGSTRKEVRGGSALTLSRDRSTTKKKSKSATKKTAKKKRS